jgi:transposase
VTNKEAKGKKGTLLASIKGTLSQDIIQALNQIPLEQRKQVKEVTLDMANHFHVIKLAMEALQHIRVKNRWEEMDKENLAITQAKEKGEKYKPTLLPNEDTPKQLLARCRYVIVKKSSEWTPKKKSKAII